MTRSARWLVGLSSALIAIIASAGAATARIVVNRSIDGVGLGATKAAVRGLRGQPSLTIGCSVFTVCLPGTIPGTISWTYGKQPTQTSFVFINGHVALMGTFSHSERTPAGVGPGTSFQVAKQRYPQLKRYTSLPGHPPNGYYITPPPTKTGDNFTMLIISSAHVGWIEIGRWNSSRRYTCDFSLC